MKKTSEKHSAPLPKSLGAQIRNILVPIDFSAFSEEALAYAQPIATAFKAGIDLIYADETNYGEIAAFGPIDVDLLKTQYGEESHQKIKQLEKDLHDRGFRSTGLVRSGRAHYVITETAKELKSDLIIIATHGRSGLEHLLMGSTAENVVRHAPCPVLSVRVSNKTQ